MDTTILANPEVFKVNCLPAHSDHVVYASMYEMETGKGLLPLQAYACKGNSPFIHSNKSE